MANGYCPSPAISGGEVRLYNLIQKLHRIYDTTFISSSGGIASIKMHMPKLKINLLQIRHYIFIKKEFFLFGTLIISPVILI